MPKGFPMLVELIIVAVVIVVVYHYVDKDSFYGALVGTKDTVRYTAHGTAKLAKTGVKAYKVSKTMYDVEELEHTYSYQKAGKDYKQEMFKRDRKVIQSMDDALRPINTVLDTKLADASIRKSELQDMIDALMVKDA